MDDQELLYYSSLHSTSSFDYSISQQPQPAAQEDIGSWGSCSFHDNRDSNNNITPKAVVYGSEQMGSAGKSSSSGSGPDAAYSSSSSSLMLLAEIQNHQRIDTTATTSQQHQQEHQDIRARIASHPLYPNLLSAHIDCHQVGAPPEMDRVLDEIRREGDVSTQNSVVSSCCRGADPELDEFMESYCDILVKHKSDLSKPFDEASSFLSSMEAQLNSLCSGLSRNNDHDAAAAGGSSEEEISGCETTDQVPVPECMRMPPVDREIKDKLIRKYGGYISTLKHEFSKSKKKGKLPKDARQILFEWWNLHNKWPYPTEADKVALAETTGLDQRQINNWFINQRKRHWKPPETVQLHLMDNVPIFHE